MAAERGTLFGSVELARRIERAEVGLLVGSAAAAGRRDGTSGARAVEIAGGMAVWTGPGQPFNKVAGLGFAGPLDADQLSAIETMYRDHGAPTRVELATLAEPSVGELLTRRGYVLEGFENVLARRLDDLEAVRPTGGITVRECGPDDVPLWVDLVIEGFAHPDEQGVGEEEVFPREALVLAFHDLAGTPGFVRLIAEREGRAAGGGSLRLADGVAQLCGAATLPEHRRKGVQSALLAHRLAAAAAAGCDVAVVTTQPGSKSQENVQRAGFSLVYSRAVLVLR